MPKYSYIKFSFKSSKLNILYEIFENIIAITDMSVTTF